MTRRLFLFLPWAKPGVLALAWLPLPAQRKLSIFFLFLRPLTQLGAKTFFSFGFKTFSLAQTFQKPPTIASTGAVLLNPSLPGPLLFPSAVFRLNIYFISISASYCWSLRTLSEFPISFCLFPPLFTVLPANLHIPDGDKLFVVGLPM